MARSFCLSPYLAGDPARLGSDAVSAADVLASLGLGATGAPVVVRLGSRVALVHALSGFFWVYWLSGWRPGLPMAASGDLYLRATTMSLCGIVAAQVGNVFACRTERASVFRVGLLKNRLVLLGIACELALVTTLIAVRPLRHAFGLAPLSPREWAPLIAFPPAMLLLEESRKWVMRNVSRRHPSPGRVRSLLAVLLLAVALAPRMASAGVPAARSTDVVGGIFEVRVRPGDTLGSIGARHGESVRVLARENGLTDPDRVRPGQLLRVDNRHVVPAGGGDGIRINVPQRMLFLLEEARVASPYPVGLGRPDWPTPLGRFEVAGAGAGTSRRERK